MKNSWKVFAVCLSIDLLLFYIPTVLIFGDHIVMLQGIWGTNMDLFYTHAYVFIFLLVSLYVLALKVIHPYTKGAWIRSLLSIPFYVLFIFLSVLFISLYSTINSSVFEVKAFVKDFNRVFIEALIIGILMIVFSPITYLIIINHWLVTRYFFRPAIKE